MRPAASQATHKGCLARNLALASRYRVDAYHRCAWAYHGARCPPLPPLALQASHLPELARFGQPGVEQVRRGLLGIVTESLWLRVP
jgi:hypothetical protein